MVGVDLTTMLVIFVAFLFLFLALDFLFARGMTGALIGNIIHGSAGMLGTPYGWIVILTLVVAVLVLFGSVFGNK